MRRCTQMATIMDQQGTKNVRLSSLHRGALREILVDKMNKPLEKGENSSMQDNSSCSSLPNEKVERRDSEPRRYKIPLKEFQSEPRPSLRRRCTSRDYAPERLFEERYHLPTTEAFPLRSRLRQRKGAARIHDTEQRQALLTAIRKRVTHRPRSEWRPRSRWLIPAEHPFKVLWDIITVILSIANAHAKHASIRDRKFGASPFMWFCDIWFFVDILLNFVTERRTAEGEILRDYRSICARYLTSWFAVDALSLFPWENLYVKPIIDLQNRRGFFRKSFLRSKAVVRVTRHLRGKHFRWFGTVTRHSRQHGVGAKRLLRLIIKYAPKYVLFLRNMKGVVAVRVLRQFHWLRRFYKNMIVEEKGDERTGSITQEDFDDDISSNGSLENSSRVRVVYEDWETMDDGVPL